MLKRVLARCRAVLFSSRADAELTREIDAHLQLLEDDFVAGGMSRDEARLAARRAFGGQIEQTKLRHRDARGFPTLDRWSLDIRLALRMMVRFPGLTAIAVLGMTVAIAIALGAFTIGNRLLTASLPLHEGERIVAIQLWDTETRAPERRTLHDVRLWQRDLTTVEDLGVFRLTTRTSSAQGVAAAVVPVAEMSAAGFRIARVAPLLGRYLLDADDAPGAPPVLVISSDVWRSRFGSDPHIVGRAVQLGRAQAVIVGVMPPGFAFPVNHDYWVPLGAAPELPARQGPEVWAFGRLAPGATRESAQAQLAGITAQVASSSPATHASLRAQVVPYTYPFSDMDDPDNALALRLIQVIVVTLLIIVCVNVAILVHARTATRHAEIAVRTALGAGRGRIVAQLFVEALALSLVAGVLALAAVSIALSQVELALARIPGELPFWLNFHVTPGAVLYTLALAVAGAAIIGAAPALKVTGTDVQIGLKQTSGGASTRLGGLWTSLIVAQVAVAVALLPVTLYHAWDATRHGVTDTGFAAHEYLHAQLAIESGSAAAAGRRNAEYVQRVKSLADVANVTYARAAAGFESSAWLEIDGVEAAPHADAPLMTAGTARGERVLFNRIDPEWFRVHGVAMLAGRAFTSGDQEPATATAVVNRAFADQFLSGANPLGRRFRYAGFGRDVAAGDVDLERSYEIVGVVEDFPAASGSRGPEPRVYHAAPIEAFSPVTLTVRVRDTRDPDMAQRLISAAAALDPALQVRNLRALDDLLLQEQSIFRVIAAILVIVTASVMLLSAAGIYALMACVVEQRRKEIGIRTALGADARRLLTAIVGRAVLQLGAGAAVGSVVALGLDAGSGGELMAHSGGVLMPVVAALMTTVGVCAAWGPARRGLRIQPIQVLRE